MPPQLAQLHVRCSPLSCQLDENFRLIYPETPTRAGRLLMSAHHAQWNWNEDVTRVTKDKLKENVPMVPHSAENWVAAVSEIIRLYRGIAPNSKAAEISM